MMGNEVERTCEHCRYAETECYRELICTNDKAAWQWVDRDDTCELWERRKE